MVQEGIRLSLITPCKDKNDPKLLELIKSIEAQDFPKHEMEHLVITEGTSESAKAIGIKKARGEVIGFLASDNELVEKDFLDRHYRMALSEGSAQSCYYHYDKNDNALNRYFSLFGMNDPLAFYMNKCDRLPRIDWKGRFDRPINSTIGDNGYFVQKYLIEATDLDNYYHIDNSNETGVIPFTLYSSIWHKTGGNILTFFKKRYHYGLQHAFNKNRRWHLVDFNKPKDIWRLTWFIICTVTVIEPLMLSIRGWLKIKDKAWFLHWPICVMTLGTYTLLILHHALRSLRQSLSVPMGGQKA